MTENLTPEELDQLRRTAKQAHEAAKKLLENNPRIMAARKGKKTD